MGIIKKIAKYLYNPAYRFYVNSILGLYKGMSDEEYLKKVFKMELGYELDLEHPRSFNEKIQWIKVHSDSDYLSSFVDKVKVKDIVAGIIGEEHIVPTIGVYNSAKEIDFSTLPRQFVLKCNHDSGSVIIVRDKDKINPRLIKKKLQAALKKGYSSLYREHAYEKVERKIICEKYIKQSNQIEGITDYKFFCFNGKARFLYISKGLENHSSATVSFYDMKMNLLPFQRADYSRNNQEECCPSKWEEMIEIAEKLSEGFAFVRVDLYCVDDTVYFSEYTFTPCAGMMPFVPQQYDLIVGEMIDLDSTSRGLNSVHYNRCQSNTASRNE